MWLALATAAWADDVPQYRKIVTSDGRRFVGEVLSTESDGLRLRVPQGRTTIGFDLLLDMTPASERDYDAQTPWRVWLVAPVEVRAPIAASLAAVPAVRVLSSDDVRPEIAAALADCLDTACAAEALKNAPFTWVIMAEGSRVAVRTNKTDEVLRRLKPEDATAAALLEIEPDGTPPSGGMEAAKPAEAASPRRVFLRASAFSGTPELAGVSAMVVPIAPFAAEISVAWTGVEANPLTFAAVGGAMWPVVDGPQARGGVDVTAGGLGGFRWFVTPDRGIVFAPEVKGSADLSVALAARGPALDVHGAIGLFYAGKVYADLRLGAGVAF